MIPGPRGWGIFLAMHEFQPIPAELIPLTGAEAAAQRDYVMWGLLTRPSTVTLLGDATHSMPPAGGIGATTALRDAALLCHRLASAARGEVPLLEAIADYETDMRQYGFDAVRGSLRNLRRQQRTENPWCLPA
jgi:2-polyprenyl-6-methoxyphenol hydroxylase-like FAD-dependent oxidoreductase